VRETLYGRQPVRECLRARRRHIHRLTLAKGVKETGIIGEILTLASGLDIPTQSVPRTQLDRIARSHQGAALEVAGYPYVTVETVLGWARKQGEAPFLLALDHLQDPHNLGALLRTAEAVGVHGVIVPGRRAVGVTPAVVGASAGASEHVRVAQVTNLVHTLEMLKAAGIWVVGLDSGPSVRSLEEVDLDMQLVLVVGAEGTGLRRLMRRTCDVLVRLPMRGQMESLNASVAGGVVLYAALASRGFSAE